MKSGESPVWHHLQNETEVDVFKQEFIKVVRDGVAKM
jgi:hypothetical protein